MQIYKRRMKTVCKKNLEVFDFKEETEVPELARRIKSKLENPKNAIDKYAFLATAAAGKDISTEEINYIPSIGIDAVNIDHIATTLVDEDSSARMMLNLHDTFTVAEQHSQSSPQLGTDLSGSGVTAPGEAEVTVSISPSNTKINPTILNLLPSLPELSETVETDPDDNGRMCETSSSDVAENDGILAGPSSNHCVGVLEMDNEDLTRVVFYPDYVVYRGSYYTDSILSFTSSFIEMEGSTTYEDEKAFKCKWGIEDVIHIRSSWYERVEMAMVKIHLLTKDTVDSETVECTSGTELKFAVIGSDWYGRLEAITSLNVTYKALWSSMLESEDSLGGLSCVSFTNYLPNFVRPFEEVVYPKGDADAVSLSKRDFDLLQPDTFVNDTIIDFYIKFLKNKIKPEERHRFHFFNSFFFRKLADPDKDPLNASEGQAAFQRVKKWTRKVNLFEKDYVFIPVNYSYHWSLIVICHLGDVATFQDEDVNESIKVPCVLHMDSIRGSHTGLKGLVQSYLREEWKERRQETSEDISSRFDNLRFISLELPQQQNSFDCGLFLLHYVELFLEQAPLHFNPFKITKTFNFLKVDWFPPSEASLKRVVIQKLICHLLENPHQEPLPTSSNEQHCSASLSLPTTNIHKENHNLSKPHLTSQEDNGSFLRTPFPEFSQTTGFDGYKSSLTPIEEDVEGGVHFVYFQTEPGLQQTFKDSSLACHPPVISDHHFVSSPETSTSGREDSIEITDSKKIDEPLKENGYDDNLTSSMDILPSRETKKMRMTGIPFC